MYPGRADIALPMNPKNAPAKSADKRLPSRRLKTAVPHFRIPDASWTRGAIDPINEALQSEPIWADPSSSANSAGAMRLIPSFPPRESGTAHHIGEVGQIPPTVHLPITAI